MKKIINIILTLIIVLGLSGCTDTEPLETRLDELELQLEEFQYELDEKDELLDIIVSDLANLNSYIYADASILADQIIEILQSKLDDNIYDDTHILELIAELQLWQDNVDNAPYNSTVESEVALFNVGVDFTEINSSQEVITVTVEITAKTEINDTLSTSSYGEPGLIEIKIVNIEDESVYLYDELYLVAQYDDNLDVHLDVSQTLTRSLQFGRIPIYSSLGSETEPPEGLYRVIVGLQYPGPGVDWIYTDIIINVTD